MPIDTGKTFDDGPTAADIADYEPYGIVPDGWRAEVRRTRRARPAASGRAPQYRAVDLLRAGGGRPVEVTRGAGPGNRPVPANRPAVVLLGQDTRARSEPASVSHPDGSHTGAAGDPIGRGGELAMLGAFLDQARPDGAALLIVGEPGAGKTRLLDAAAEMALAAGTRVLRVAAWSPKRICPSLDCTRPCFPCTRSSPGSVRRTGMR